MAKTPRTLLWDLDDHTRGKHEVLRAYLGRWLPILGKTQGRIVFIDGFAGPGRYRNGEPGSPLIALETLLGHPSARGLRAEVVLLFIDDDARRLEHLRGVLESVPLPEKPVVRWELRQGQFDGALAGLLDDLESQAARMAPAFVMIDPFGISQTPMAMVKRILRHPKSEVFVTFMIDRVHRFVADESIEGHLDELFGTPEWRKARELTGQARRGYLLELYAAQLRAAGARYVLRFELYRGGQLVYSIFFATQSLVGCAKMKEAIWSVIPDGSFEFRAARGGQRSLELVVDDTWPLRGQLYRRFGTEWATIEAVDEFMDGDETLYRKEHLRRKTLVPLEKEGAIEVQRTGRAGSFGPGTRIRFTREPS